MNKDEEMKEIEEQNLRRESELISKYGADITKMRKRAYYNRG